MGSVANRFVSAPRSVVAAEQKIFGKSGVILDRG